MKSEEKKIIFISFLVLVVVIVWAVMIHFDRKANTSQTNKVIETSSNDVSTSPSPSSDAASTQKNTGAQIVKTKNNDQGVPVIMYHSVSDDTASDKMSSLRITVENFKAQMKYLKDNNFTTLTMDELNDFLVNNKPVPEKSVVLTFDDGYEDNYTNVYNILKQNNFKATIFVITNAIDKTDGFLTSAQLKEMQANGIDIESGTSDDVKIGNLNSDKQLKSLQNSKQWLETLLNKKVSYVSYPLGSYNKDTLNDAGQAGYLLGLSWDGKWTYKTDGAYKLSRIYIGQKHSEAEFEDRVNNPNFK